VILKTALDGSDDSMLCYDSDEVKNGSSMCKEDEGTECDDRQLQYNENGESITDW
jgi:hypothetical protein